DEQPSLQHCQCRANHLTAGNQKGHKVLRFIWPSAEGGAVAISSAQLSYLLSGIDWRAPQETWRPSRV
ncbi:hypothetical protein NKH48_35880, partial [Mesorhizobium sp. M1233]